MVVANNRCAEEVKWRGLELSLAVCLKIHIYGTVYYAQVFLIFEMNLMLLNVMLFQCTLKKINNSNSISI